MPLFFGFVGIINVFLLWPFGVILHFTGIERFEWPSGNALIIGLLINAAITLWAVSLSTINTLLSASQRFGLCIPDRDAQDQSAHSDSRHVAYK